MIQKPMRCGLAATSGCSVTANTTCDAKSARSDGPSFKLPISGAHNDVAILQGPDKSALNLDVLAN